MEQVNCALPLLLRVFVAQLIGQPENIRPADPGVNQQPGLQILFDLPKSQPALVLGDLPEGLRIAQSIPQPKAMERIAASWLLSARRTVAVLIVIRTCLTNSFTSTIGLKYTANSGRTRGRFHHKGTENTKICRGR
jgi:hypothetical protein